MSIDLLDYMTLATGTDCVSDLRFKKVSVRRVVEDLSAVSLFSLEEWNEAGHYLCPKEYHMQASPRAAREELLRALGKELRISS